MLGNTSSLWRQLYCVLIKVVSPSYLLLQPCLNSAVPKLNAWNVSRLDKIFGRYWHEQLATTSFGSAADRLEASTTQITAHHFLMVIMRVSRHDVQQLQSLDVTFNAARFDVDVPSAEPNKPVVGQRSGLELRIAAAEATHVERLVHWIARQSLWWQAP